MKYFTPLIGFNLFYKYNFCKMQQTVTFLINTIARFQKHTIYCYTLGNENMYICIGYFINLCNWAQMVYLKFVHCYQLQTRRGEKELHFN